MTSRNALLKPLRSTAVRTIKAAAERLRPASIHQLCYIHIGKCGGATVSTSIKSSPVIAKAFDRVSTTHVARPVYKPLNRYLFVVRNPIDRAISAFNWRYRLVHEETKPDYRFSNEAEILKRYGTLEALALALYDGGRLDQKVSEDFRSIHHLKEDIAFYLEPAWDVIDAEQVYAVLCQETLNADIERYLGSPTFGRVHDNRSTMPDDRTRLSDEARINLARFLARDFAALERLMTLFPLSEDRRASLLKI